MKKRILLDCDDCLYNMLPHLLDLYNKTTDDNVSIHDITTWDIYDKVKYPEVIIDMFNSPEFFFELELNKGAKEVVKELNEEYDLCIVTAGSPRAIIGKQASLNTKFPYLRNDQIFYGFNKGIYKADIMIDDSIAFHKQFRETNQEGVSIVFDLPHNREADFPHYRVTDFYQVYDIIEKLKDR